MSKLLPSVQYKGHCDTSSFFSHERNELSSAFPKQYRNLSNSEIHLSTGKDTATNPLLQT